MIRYGIAGFDYKDWEGRVYPKPRPKTFDRLAYVSRFFDVVEINSSFYGPPKADTAADWAERVKHSERFRFTLKLWRRFTHERTQAWTQAEVDSSRAAFDVLAEYKRLGAVLLQFPWSFKRTDENEEWLQDLLTAFAAYPLVVEVRHLTWSTPEFLTTLFERGVGLVNIDQPLFKSSIPPEAVATSSTGYVRLHGRNYKEWFSANAGRDERYDYLYPADELRPWAERVKEVAANPKTQDTYVVTNNHFMGKAPTNALMLQALVEGRPVEAPATLFRTYEKVMAPFATPVSETFESAEPRTTG